MDSREQLKMALSVDSAVYQPWWPVEEAIQAQLESTPLLSSEKQRQKYDLHKWRVVFPRNDGFQKDLGRVSRVYSGNRIQTTKYTILSFLPQNLFEQFHRSANVYFLFLVAINWFPQLEVFHREIAMLPLAVVLLVTAVKDGIEDYKRYRFDQQINSSTTKAYNSYKKTGVTFKGEEDVKKMCFIKFLREVPWFRRPCCQVFASDSENEEPGKRRKRKTKKEETKRVIVPNVHFKDKWQGNPNNYDGNKIKTTQYSLLSFIPKNAFEQFHRFANFYFVAIAALNFVPVINAFEPEISVIPVCVIMTITAIKDAWEDFRRFKLDKEINGRGCLIYS
ncbi:putative phospholipid-transporting ATPase VB, partial [Varanus komodoensis]